ncbi:MAG: hypothetical protein H7Z13_04815 [Ferruginibacter sp.]|nr:hypothetical protein [Ferruginibacter sp.]
MPANTITRMLASLTGQLITNNEDEERALESLQTDIAAALISQDLSGVSNQQFLFEKSDLFAAANLGTRLEKIEKIVADAQTAVNDEDRQLMQVFERTVPIRTTQISGSVTAAAAGSRVTTLGPFIDSITGRPKWFDFIKIKELIPLFVQGQAEPCILFNASFNVPRIKIFKAPKPQVTRNFTIIPDTVWILARLFDPAAPAGYYAGLRVKSGTLTLNADPQLIGDKLTISTTTTATCSLTLEQNNAFATDPTSPYGIDARNALYQLPQNFLFTFQNTSKKILEIGAGNWQVYGQKNNFKYGGNQVCVYNPLIARLAIPMICEDPAFEVSDCQSKFCTISGKARIDQSWWGIPVAKINIAAPTEADGNGAWVAFCGAGLFANWVNLQNNRLALPSPVILGEPGRIAITELKGNASGAQQDFNLWRDELNPYGSAMQLSFGSAMIFLFNTLAKGDEMIAGMCNADVQTDRPVKVDGNAVAVKSKSSLVLMTVNKLKKSLHLVDENMLWDNKLPADKIPKVRPYALAMHNALFTVTPPNGLIIFAEINDDFKALKSGKMYLHFALFSYLPTLPDPYAANLGVLESQFIGTRKFDATGKVIAGKRDSKVSAWLIGLVQWEPGAGDEEKVEVSFHFAPLQTPLQIEKDNTSPNNPFGIVQGDNAFLPAIADAAKTQVGTSDLNFGNLPSFATSRVSWERLRMDDFALLDVSSKANQMGIAFSYTNNLLQKAVAQKYDINIKDEVEVVVFPIQMRGLDVVTPGKNAQAFTVPQISWEPVLNTTAPQCLPGAMIPDPANPDKTIPASPPFDPPIGWNYYQNDGLPTRIGNLGKKEVALAPIPMAKYLVHAYRKKEDGKTYAMFNLPFGMLAISFLSSNKGDAEKENIDDIMPVFEAEVLGGLQLELTGGLSVNPGDGRLFEGFTFQLHNINDAAGVGAQYSTLAHSPDIIFGGEFSDTLNMPPGRPAVPLERIDISGYGASAFSNWENKDALFAQTSQAFFNVAVGRTSREVIQVKSMVYPWGIRVVRTITLFRMGNGYVARVDSGWQAQSDGLFDFRYPVTDHLTKKKVTKLHPNPFNFHPGLIRGLRNIRNIREVTKAYSTTTKLVYLWKEGVGGFPLADEPEKTKIAILQGISFDCDVEMVNVVEGGNDNLVSSKGVTGYVQLAPPAAPLDATAFKGLMGYEKNTIGGPVNCTIKIAGTNQRMRLDRFDVNTSVDAGGKPAFAGAVRGAVVLPKDGSWTMVQHSRGSGEITPMPDKLSVPLICEGLINLNSNSFPNIANTLQRIAFPNDLLKATDNTTINFGFLQNMNTQKVLFLTPAFKNGVQSLMSKTPPLLADSYRLMNTNGIFPNVGNGENTFGTAIQLLKGIDGAGNAVEAFSKPGIADNLGNQLYEVLELKAKEEAGKLLDQGYKLMKAKGNELLDKALKFDLPTFEYPLVNLEDVLKIYVEYKAKSNPKKAPKDYVGKFDFDVDSFAGDMADTWKGRMNNLAMVVDLGPLKRLMTIKGNFNSQKGKETDFGSKPDGDASGLNLPTPEIEFSDAVEAVIKILEILQALSTGKYGEALKKGLKIAMSNSANIWEYKFEATKEIAMVRFPPEANLYEAPTTPLKLEASMSLGVFFNAALKVTTDPSQLLPTAGAFFKFHGGLQVMCVSLAAGTVYAVGSADLTLRADTSPLISLTMKFGFGAQITVGLAVVGNVSVLFMVGVEIYVDSSSTVIVTAFMLFRGHAELLAGLVSITITIEARGSIEKPGDGAPCTCKAQVTFAIDISIFLVINLNFSESWEESRQIA